ncbi:MAG: hypothetical protein KGL38_13845 [Gemmatimonadota bacterium]|nr:hypothetical protein [Gemmatimonadota bacterium]MDE3129087.1 hypothetical protein [Gemmatimonadota bacterium]MDE3173683.1 hypothetical protein [Gemmatimonadota bacterium]MDE3215577.1 hypothetical protein [Gemmatimonadota bacterium]
MKKLFGTLGATAASTVGWMLVAKMGIMTAFIVSTIAGGVGAYYGVKLANNIMP